MIATATQFMSPFETMGHKDGLGLRNGILFHDPV